MSNIGQVPEELLVGRGDPVYMAHAYLTKVPVPAIVPFIEAYTKPGGVVVDPFAGSGMTGVAAAVTGRTARLFDVSVLGRHIGRNYVNFVDSHLLAKHADEVVAAVRRQLGDIYGVQCMSCNRTAQLAKTICSLQVRCRGCQRSVSYYQAMKAAGWSKSAMHCPHCGTTVTAKDDRSGEAAEVDSIICACSSTQREQPSSAPLVAIDFTNIAYPRVEITPDRQMYKAQSLGRSGLTTIASFYSHRNLAVLTTLHAQIMQVTADDLRNKLLFAFTAILTRASKRYQWSPMRPLNAANANYYVAPVFYEWNVFDLFLRKVQAVIRSDEWISVSAANDLFDSQVSDADVAYELGSADAIPLADGSVDYVFTDPPFGSNLFYADMALFQEAWLGSFTDVSTEAVVDRGVRKNRSANRYEEMLTQALRECRRILKPGGRISMVFGNSTGSMWSLVQRSIQGAGLVIQPDNLVVLNKGQRSVKGLASGFEHVATLDLIMTMAPAAKIDDHRPFATPPAEVIRETARATANSSSATTPSHVYLELLRTGIREHWDLSQIDLRLVTGVLTSDGWRIDEASGRLQRACPAE